MARNDSALLAIVSAGSANTYVDVLDRLQAIQAELDASDGLTWFNRLYTAMTSAVIDQARHFQDPVFLERLDCHFANLYFVALAAHLSDPGAGPACWQPLFEARVRQGILPAQYAIAGVNAHINRDLPVALVMTFLELDVEPDREGAAYADYQRINAILESVLADAKLWLLTRGLLELDAALGQLDDVLQTWSLRRAREAAWVASEVRWLLRVSPVVSRYHLDVLDRMVALAGHGLLRPLPRVALVAAPAERLSSIPGR